MITGVSPVFDSPLIAFEYFVEFKLRALRAGKDDDPRADQLDSVLHP